MCSVQECMWLEYCCEDVPEPSQRSCRKSLSHWSTDYPQNCSASNRPSGLTSLWYKWPLWTGNTVRTPDTVWWKYSNTPTCPWATHYLVWTLDTFPLNMLLQLPSKLESGGSFYTSNSTSSAEMVVLTDLWETTVTWHRQQRRSRTALCRCWYVAVCHCDTVSTVLVCRVYSEKGKLCCHCNINLSKTQRNPEGPSCSVYKRTTYWEINFPLPWGL